MTLRKIKNKVENQAAPEAPVVQHMPHDPSPHLLHLRLPSPPPEGTRTENAPLSLPQLPTSNILSGVSKDEYRSLNPRRARTWLKRLKLSLLSAPVQMYRDLASLSGRDRVPKIARHKRVTATTPKRLKITLPKFPTFYALRSTFSSFRLPELAPTRGALRSLAGFIIFSLLLLSPFEIASRVTAAAALARRVPPESTDALQALLNGIRSGSPSASGAAADSFSLARYDLGRALSLLGGLPTLLPAANEKIESGARLLSAAQSLSEAATIVTSGAQAARSDAPPLTRIRTLSNSFAAALPLFSQALADLRGVNPQALPEISPNLLSTVTDLVAVSESTIRDLARATDVALTLFASDEPRRYLLIFQNNTELRPTGGFIGSFAEIDVRKGEILAMRMPGGGSYDLQGSLRARVAAPRPLQLIQPTWQFQDANWFPDFPTSAKKLAWFYEKSGGPTVDGVIAVTAGLMTDLLEITGPIDMPEYGKTITAENFVMETQKAVELEYDRTENKPKKFLADLAPRLIERIRGASQEKALALLDTIDRALRSRDIQLYARHPELQAKVASLGWDGALLQTEGDYFSLVQANIGGQKTDAVTVNRVHHHADVSGNGEITVTVTIEREHRGAPGELFTGVRNVSYVRAYVPKGSVLLSATGFIAPPAELFESPPQGTASDADLTAVEGIGVTSVGGTRTTEEFGKTVFGNWLQVDPGETVSAELRYRIPLRLELSATGDPATYTLLVQKQPGLRSFSLRHSISLPAEARAAWAYPETVPAPLTGDLLFGTLITHE